jgi:hypothetical protein
MRGVISASLKYEVPVSKYYLDGLLLPVPLPVLLGELSLLEAAPVPVPVPLVAPVALPGVLLLCTSRMH